MNTDTSKTITAEYIKALFASATTSSDCSQLSEQLADLADEAKGREANRLARLSSAFNEQRHCLNATRLGLTALAMQHSNARDRELEQAGIR